MSTAKQQKDAPAFDFYPERFWFAVAGWSEGEICRYWRLLGQQWMRRGLPADPKALKELACGKLSDRVIEKFPVDADGLRRNAFLETLRGEQRERIFQTSFRNARVAFKRYNPQAQYPKHLATLEAYREHQKSTSGTPEEHQESTKSSVHGACAPPTTHHPPCIDHTHTGPEVGQDVEFPSWYPATAAKAIAMCQTIGGVPSEYIASVWAQVAGRDFKDGAGQEVRRFAMHIAYRWPKEKDKWGKEAAFGTNKPLIGKPNGRDERGQRPSEIKTDVTAAKIPRITPQAAP